MLGGQSLQAWWSRDETWRSRLPQSHPCQNLPARLFDCGNGNVVPVLGRQEDEVTDL